MLRATWGEETFEIPHSKKDGSPWAQFSEWEPDWVSEEATPPEEPKEHECLKPGPNRRAVAPEPRCEDRGLPPRMAAPELRPDETTVFLCRVLGACDEDSHLSALSTALEMKSGLPD